MSKCSWKKAPTDLLNAGLPQTFSLSKANTVSVKCNKARTALNSSSLCGNSEGQGRSRAVSRRGPLWAGLPGPLAGCVLAHWSLGPPALALRCWPPNTEATYWTPPESTGPKGESPVGSVPWRGGPMKQHHEKVAKRARRNHFCMEVPTQKLGSEREMTEKILCPNF